MSRKRGLGMGLEALLSGDLAPQAEGAVVEQVPIDFLKPSPLQPRRRFPDAEMTALADSIRSRGLLQPLVVRPAPAGLPGYEIVAGERRWRAAQAAGLHELPVLVRPLSDGDVLEIALVENLQRQDLSPIEEAEAYKRLIEEYGHSQEELATALGRSRSHVANTLRLLNLPSEVRGMVEDGQLTAGHARAVLASAQPLELAHEIVEKDLSVRAAEALAQERTRPSTLDVPPDPDVVACEDRLSACLGLKVKIRQGATGGTLTIRYKQPDQLEAIIARLDAGRDESG